jgi:hypothetical protein
MFFIPNQHSRQMSTSLELVAFRGIQNFETKLLSPLLTRYGMDRDGQPKVLIFNDIRFFKVLIIFFQTTKSFKYH